MIEKDRSYLELTEKLDSDPGYWVESMRFDFVEEVERIMEERGVTRAELARRLNSSPAYVTQMFKGLFNPTLLTLAKVALALDARVDLKLAPRRASPGKSRASVHNPRRREVLRELVAADGRPRPGRSDFIASDKPAKPRSRKP
jgi:transcriptional regulator with XRE-family HTH domain